MKLERIGSLLPKQLAGRGSLVFFAGVLGVFLLIAGGLPFSGKENAADASAASGATRQWSEAYVRQLEETLTELIGSIEGADDVTVNAQITQAVSVLTGVSTNRISISKMS